MGKRNFRKISIIIPIIFTLLGFLLLFHVLSPEIEYQIDPPNEEIITEKLDLSSKYTENKLIIPSIGVDMLIGQDQSFLDYGGWIQGVDTKGNPNLIAVHRFGWSTFSTEKKMKQTLYHVYKLTKGDKVFVIWNGRKYEYEVVDIVEGKNNPELNNLMLYTCKFYSSTQRIFVLLEVINYS